MPGMDTPLITITFVWTDHRTSFARRADVEEAIATLTAEGRADEVEPLVEGEVWLVRLWYEVPRRGEHVTLTRPVTSAEGLSLRETFTGIVRQVFWTDDGVRIEFNG